MQLYPIIAQGAMGMTCPVSSGARYYSPSKNRGV